MPAAGIHFNYLEQLCKCNAEIPQQIYQTCVEQRERKRVHNERAVENADRYPSHFNTILEWVLFHYIRPFTSIKFIHMSNDILIKIRYENISIPFWYI